METAFVTVARFNTAPEAHILRGRLEGEGLRVVLADEETVSMAWHFGQAVGGIKVQVRSEDADRARAIIADQPRDDVTAPVDTPERLVNRALRAAFFGIFLPPLQLYSLWLVGRLAVSYPHRSREVNQGMILAIIVDLWIILLGMLVVRAVTAP